MYLQETFSQTNFDNILKYNVAFYIYVHVEAMFLSVHSSAK